MNSIKENIQNLAYKLIDREDFKQRRLGIKTIEISSGINIIIRIYLSKQNSNIAIDDCVYFHREFQLLLKVEGIWDDNIKLEVSSPGIDNSDRR